MVNTVKFSEFATAPLTSISTGVVGLESGVNVQSSRYPVWTTATRPTPPFDGLMGVNSDFEQYEWYSSISSEWFQFEDSGDIASLIARLAAHTVGDGASMIGLLDQGSVTNKTVQDLANAQFVVNINNGSLQNAQSLGSLTTGIVKNTTTTGVLSISAPLTQIDNLTPVQGDLLYHNGSAWVVLAPSTSGFILQTQGAGANPQWVLDTGTGTVTSISSGTGITLTPSPITTTGSIALAAIADNTFLANVSGGVLAPSSTTLTTFIDEAIGNTQGAILYRDATIWTLLSPGADGQLLQTKGAAANPAYTSSIWPSTVGSVGKIIRSDGTVNTYSTATFSDTYAASVLLYSNGANNVTGLATANDSLLVTGATGIPSLTTVLPPAVTATTINFTAGGVLEAGHANTNTLKINAYDVDGAIPYTFITLTSGNTPTGDLDSSMTIGGSSIARGGANSNITSMSGLTGDIGNTIQKIVHSPNPAVNQTVTGLTSSSVAGENLSFGNLVYVASDEKVYKADNTVAAKFPAIFMAAESATTNNAVQILELGFAGNVSWSWTQGGLIYLSTSGDMTQTQPSSGAFQIVGVATDTFIVHFKPQLPSLYQPVNAQTGTTYTITAFDNGRTLTFSNAGSITVTLPQQSNLTTPAGFSFNYQNIGAGTVTFVKEGAETLTGNTICITNGSGRIVRTSTTNWSNFGGTSTRSGSYTSGIIETVGNNTYTLAFESGTKILTGATSVCTSGTCTATFSIAGTPVTATANAVSSTPQTQPFTAASTAVNGNQVTYAITSNSSCLNMSLTVYYTTLVNEWGDS